MQYVQNPQNLARLELVPGENRITFMTDIERQFVAESALCVLQYNELRLGL